MMSRPLDTRALLEQLESALDVGCAVLVALRGRANTGARDDGRVQGQIRQVISLLRRTVGELRAARRHSLLAFGFVLEAGSDHTALALDGL